MATRRPKRRQSGLHVYQRGPRWWVHIPGRGADDARVSLGLDTATVTHEEALRVAAERFGAGALSPREAQGRVASLTELSERFTAECADRWSARQRDNVTYRLPHFVAAMEALGARTIDAITDDTLARYVAAERERESRVTGERLTTASINRTIQIARRMARWASTRTPPLCAAGALGAWRNLPEVARNRDPLIPSPQEWAAVVREMEREEPPRDTPTARERTAANARGAALLVAVAVQTGLRFDELRHLRAEDIADDAVAVRAWGEWRPKSREERAVPVPASVARLARELVVWRDRAVGVNGHRLALGGHWVEERLAAAWQRADLTGDSPTMHDCRRTFATEMSRRPGVSLRDVQRLLGHADLATTQRYLGRYRSDEARVAVDMGLAAVLSGEGSATVVPLRGRRG